MKRAIAKLIHWISPKFFTNKDYSFLSKWGIEDVYEGNLYFEYNYGIKIKNMPSNRNLSPSNDQTKID